MEIICNWKDPKESPSEVKFASLNEEECREKSIDAIVDKIARFFEKDRDKWKELKRCWMVNYRSEDLRKLLKEALEREE